MRNVSSWISATFEKVDDYVYLVMYVEKITNVYISLYSSVWNKPLDDNIYSM